MDSIKKIVINNSYSKIEGLNRTQLAELRRRFSYTDFESMRFQGFPKIIHAIDRYGNFGTGLVSKIKGLFDKHNVRLDLVDNRVKPEEKNNQIRLRKNLPFDPYPEQLEIVQKLVKDRQGIGVLGTGVGKSIVSILAINEIRQPTLIITPNLNLRNQLYQDLTYYFGSSIVNKVNKNRENKLISIANIQSIAALPDDFFSDKLFVIIDEFHSSASQSYLDMNKTKLNSCYTRLFLTATPYRNNIDENIFLDSFSSNILAEVTVEQAIDKGYIVRPNFYSVNVSHTKKELSDAENWTENSESKSEYHALRTLLVTESESFVSKLCDIIRKNKDKKTLVLIDHLDIIPKIQKNLAENSQLFAEIVTGLTSENQKKFDDFNLGKIQLMIASPVVGVGVNIKPIECLIITTPIKSRPLTIQQIGRGLRNSENKTSCDVYFFNISDHGLFDRQNKLRLEYCKEFGKYGEIKYID